MDSGVSGLGAQVLNSRVLDSGIIGPEVQGPGSFLKCFFMFVARIKFVG